MYKLKHSSIGVKIIFLVCCVAIIALLVFGAWFIYMLLTHRL